MNIVKIVVGMHKHPLVYREELSKIHVKIKKKQCLRTVHTSQSIPWVSETQENSDDIPNDNWTTVLTDTGALKKLDKETADTVEEIMQDLHLFFKDHISADLLMDMVTKRKKNILKIRQVMEQFYPDEGWDVGDITSTLDKIDALIAMPKFKKHLITNKSDEENTGWDEYASCYNCIIDQDIPISTFVFKKDHMHVDQSAPTQHLKFNGMNAAIQIRPLGDEHDVASNEDIDVNKNGFKSMEAENHGSKSTHNTYYNEELKHKMQHHMEYIDKASFCPIYYKETIKKETSVKKCMLLMNVTFQKIGSIPNMAFFIIRTDEKHFLISVDIRFCEPDQLKLGNVIKLVMLSLKEFVTRPGNYPVNESDSEAEFESDFDDEYEASLPPLVRRVLGIPHPSSEYDEYRYEKYQDARSHLGSLEQV